MTADFRGEIASIPCRAKSPLPWLWSLGVIWLATFAFLLSRHYFFLFDDFALVDLAEGTSLSSIFTSPLFGFYRPVVFLSVKLLALNFGWNTPMGYALVLSLIHGLNGVMLGLILRSLGSSRLTTLSAAALFLLSPWSSEGYSWVSALFDSLALLFFLLAVLFYVRFPDRRSWLSLAVPAASLLMALFCKENMVIFLPAFFLARAALGRTRLSRKSGLEFLLFVSIAALYLAIRGSVVGTLGGSYGHLPGLLARADIPHNFGRYVLTLFWVGGKSFPGALVLSLMYAFFAIIAVIAAFVGRTRAAAALFLMFAISLVPVSWTSTRLTTSDAGRLLYAPAIFFCALAGVGLQCLSTAVARGRRPAQKWVFGGAVLLALAGAAASAVYQANIWRYACGLSKRTVAYVLRSAHDANKDLYIRNLPFLFIEGPFILKSYAFPIYARHRFGLELRPLRCDVVHLSYKDIHLIRYGGPEPGGAVRDKAPSDEIVLDLPLDELRSKNK